MISREPTIERLAVARSLLLEPFGLDEAKLAQALATIATHRIDDADLYFQYTRSEGWSLEEGIVKSGSFGIDQGVGVRAVAGEKTAFAYSDDISEAALLDAARTVRTIAAAGRAGASRSAPSRRWPAVASSTRRWIRSRRSTARRRSPCSRRSSSSRARRIRASSR
jgi:TldD protein